jgi:hypothetical protein
VNQPKNTIEGITVSGVGFKNNKLGIDRFKEFVCLSYEFAQ